MIGILQNILLFVITSLTIYGILKNTSLVVITILTTYGILKYGILQHPSSCRYYPDHILYSAEDTLVVFVGSILTVYGILQNTPLVVTR